MPLYSFSKVVSDDFDGKVDMTLRNWFCLIYWCAKAFLPLAELSETQAACQSSLCSRKGRHVVNGSGFEEPWLHLWVLRVEVNDGVSRLGSRVLVSPPTPLSWLFRMVLRTKRSFVIAEFKMNLLITNKSFRDQSSVTVQENSWLLHTGCTFLMYHWLTASCLRIDPGKKAGLWYRVQIYCRLSTESLTNNIHMPQLSHLTFVFIYLTTSFQVLFIRLRIWDAFFVCVSCKNDIFVRCLCWDKQRMCFIVMY